MSNQITGQKHFGTLANLFVLALLLACLPLPASSQPAVQPGVSAQVPTQIAERRQEVAEQFLDALFSQQYDAATQYISPIVKAEFPATVLRQKVEEFQRRTGAFVSRLEAQVDGEFVVIDLQFERQEIPFIVSFDENLNVVNANYIIQPDDSTP